MSKAKTSRKAAQKSKQTSPALWIGGVIGLLVIIVGAVFLMNQDQTPESPALASLPAEISVDEAYELYQEGVFFLDVRTQEEWDEYHAPNATLIPLDELPNRLSELPQDEQIVVVCRSGNRSQAGRDTLLSAGFEDVTSMAGGLSTWRSAGYPVAP